MRYMGSEGVSRGFGKHFMMFQRIVSEFQSITEAFSEVSECLGCVTWGSKGFLGRLWNHFRRIQGIFSRFQRRYEGVFRAKMCYIGSGGICRRIWEAFQEVL